jgi:hypothetical protein
MSAAQFSSSFNSLGIFSHYLHTEMGTLVPVCDLLLPLVLSTSGTCMARPQPIVTQSITQKPIRLLLISELLSTQALQAKTGFMQL